MTSTQREFLVQRLMEDSQKLRNSVVGNGAPMQKPLNSSDSDEHSDSSSDPGCAMNNSVDSERANVPTSAKTNSANICMNPLFANPLQYAATLASLAQMNFLPPAAASTLPLLYPHLYQSLLTFPNFDRQRLNFQSSTDCISKPASLAAPKTPTSTEKKLSTISLNSPTQQVQPSTPSPRKRGSSSAKNADPSKSRLHQNEGGTPKKARAIRKIQFDDEKSSPVSGMYIKDVADNQVATVNQVEELDESADWVEVTEEAKNELSKIRNVIGDYICRLCKVKYEDAFKLAKHKCPRIGHAEYRCPECDKVFNCPANLASHRRWHKPKEDRSAPTNVSKGSSGCSIECSPSPCFGSPRKSPDYSSKSIDEADDDAPVDLSSKQSLTVEYDLHISSANAVAAFFQCEFCKKKFDSHRLLRSHAISHTNFAQDNENDEKHAEFECDECELWFLTLDSRMEHKRNVHMKFGCKYCNEALATSPALTRHINKCHPSSECRMVLLNEVLTTNAEMVD